MWIDPETRELTEKDLIKLSSESLLIPARFLNLRLSPYQATEALFAAYHRERLFARSFKTEGQDAA